MCQDHFKKIHVNSPSFNTMTMLSDDDRGILLIYYYLLYDIVAALCKYSSHFMIRIACNELLAVNRDILHCYYSVQRSVFIYLEQKTF